MSSIALKARDRATISAVPRFASDVIHPRMMEFLMAAQPPGFRIEDGLMRFRVDSHDTQTLGCCADFAHAFFSRVPGFVWQDLRVTPPSFRVAGPAAATAPPGVSR